MIKEGTSDRLIAQYLLRLDKELAALAPSQRVQIYNDVASHIDQARRDLLVDDESAVRNLLDRVGDPEIIAAEATTLPRPPGLSRTDALVPMLLLAGGLVFLVGWVLGVVMLWSSATWRLRDKIIGTLVLPGGLVPLVLLLLHSASASLVCSSVKAGVGSQSAYRCITAGYLLPHPLGYIVGTIALLAPVATVLHLDRTRRAGSSARARVEVG